MITELFALVLLATLFTALHVLIVAGGAAELQIWFLKLCPELLQFPENSYRKWQKRAKKAGLRIEVRLFIALSLLSQPRPEGQAIPNCQNDHPCQTEQQGEPKRRLAVTLILLDRFGHTHR